MVRKILRCLPKNKWGPKVTAIEEAQDLKTLALDELLGKLLTHEIHLKEDEEGVQPKRRLALKTMNEELQSSEDESTYSDEDSMSIIVRVLKKMFKSRRFDLKKFYKKGSSSKRNEKNSKGNKFSNNKNEPNFGPCFGCRLPGHVVQDSPIIQKKAENGSKRPRKRNSSKGQ